MPLFNPKNEAERQREAVIQERNRMIMERRAIPPLRKEFNRVAREASKPSANIPGLMLTHRKNIDNILKKLYAATIKGTAKRTIQEAPKSAFIGIETKDLEGEIARLVTEWIFTNALLESVLISGTTADIIASVIASEVGAGEAVIGRAIQEAIGGKIAFHRAKMIARTETHDASQAAQLHMVENMNFPPDGKQWVAIKDHRTRKDHKSADKQTRSIDGTFDIGGKKMKRPGDRRGGASNVINCRCVMIFVDNDV